MVTAIFPRVNIDTKDFEQQLHEHLDDKAAEIALQIKKDAKAGAYSSGHKKFKDLSGRLRKSIKRKKSKFDDGGYIVKAGGPGAMQAWLIEHGHGGPRPAAPHPFLKPALDKNINFAREKFNEKME